MQTICTYEQWKKNISVDSFNWEKCTSASDESFIKKKIQKNSDKDYIFEVHVVYHKHLHDSQNALLFLPKIMKIKKCQKLVVIFIIKKM